MQQEKIEQLWKLAYKSFNRPFEALEIPGIVGNSTSSRVVAKRMLDNISRLRHGQGNTKTIHDIEADVALGMTLGWLTADTSSTMLEILGEISDE